MAVTISATILFWLSLFLLIWAYGGFSFFLSFVSRFVKKPVRDFSFKPAITIFIPAYNEEKVIAEKIDNCLALDYPRDRLEIMVCSDCSSDKTVAIAQSYAGKGVKVFDYRERSGKTGMINKAVPVAQGEIVVLTDANTMFETDAVSKMISMYSSEKIGAVLGQVKLRVPDLGYGLDKEVVYRSFEAELKYREGLFGTAQGAFGGMYSIRKKLFKPLPPNAYSNDDFLTPMKIMSRGYKVLFDKEAVSHEDTAMNVEEEFRRRVRIGAGNFQSFFFLLPMLNPFRGTAFLFYLSHKVLRWFSPMLLILVLTANIFLISEPIYLVLFLFQGAFYATALIGWILSKVKINLPMVSSIYHFSSMNLAVLLGFFKCLRGIKSAVWQSTERAVV
ncbi:MAG: glycosyltransferase [Chitinivibrionales bacterium]|nr:glycosyltransferase [Chitinivibrionales bacterium]